MTLYIGDLSNSGFWYPQGREEVLEPIPQGYQGTIKFWESKLYLDFVLHGVVAPTKLLKGQLYNHVPLNNENMF